MCGKCEPMMSKVMVGIGLVSIIMAVVCRLTGMAPMSVGFGSFAGMGQLSLLLAIALNTTKTHEH